MLKLLSKIAAPKKPVYRCWVKGEWVVVEDAVACAFDGFEGLEFFSHHTYDGKYQVTEARTGYGIDGAPDGSRASVYESRGAAIDAAELELRRIGPKTFLLAVLDVVTAREASRG